jgi:hypothetical protein
MAVLLGQVLFAGTLTWVALRDDETATIVLGIVGGVVFCLNLLLTSPRYKPWTRLVLGMVGPFLFICYGVARHLRAFGLGSAHWHDGVTMLVYDVALVHLAFWPSWVAIGLAQVVSRIISARQRSLRTIPEQPNAL